MNAEPNEFKLDEWKASHIIFSVFVLYNPNNSSVSLALGSTSVFGKWQLDPSTA